MKAKTIYWSVGVLLVVVIFYYRYQNKITSLIKIGKHKSTRKPTDLIGITDKFKLRSDLIDGVISFGIAGGRPRIVINKGEIVQGTLIERNGVVGLNVSYTIDESSNPAEQKIIQKSVVIPVWELQYTDGVDLMDFRV